MTLYIILQPEAQMDLLSSRSPTSHKYSMASSNGTPVSSKFTYSPSSLPQSAPEIATRMSAYASHSSHNHSGNITPALSRTQSMNLNAIRLNHICKNDDTFKLFIRHLAKEYCIENALFLFESQQFKKQCNEIEEQISMMTRNSKSGADLAINIPTDRMDEKDPNKAVARISTSKSVSSMNSRRAGLYSKKAKNLLSVPSTVHEQKDNEDENDDGFVVLEDGKSSPHSPHSPISDSDDRFDELIDTMEEQKMSVQIQQPRMSGTLSRSQAAKHALKLPRIASSGHKSNHYEGDNQILDFIP
eukprot:CAMPEP_0201578432 /NCGR_PEP_ID=MMETSP0190_2-20130828/25277_1 /ASSEMBLY_ACC=CAM_ASM_000263 /TAXON_ID=37353 /ORGANISM="Rosalina sp." /LENGTH=300 /DNA_ID=CAMNT_0048011587 /DNA_START=165 /DNA_END=1063 /DNA_ORIENTATION=+